MRAGVEGDNPAEAQAYLEANRTIVEETVPGSCRKCAAGSTAADLVDFEVVVSVGEDGKPIRVTSERSTPSLPVFPRRSNR